MEKRNRIRMWSLLAPLALVACAGVGGGGEGDVPRGGLDKADLIGSCEGSDCLGQSEDGNCWCDEECDFWGDCCSDKKDTCGADVMEFQTYNMGLAHGAVALAEERIDPLVAAMSESNADVLCLQEVWTDDDAEAIADAVAGQYPYSFRQKTKNDSSDWFACTPGQWDDLYSLNSCVSEKCKPQGISMFECIKQDPEARGQCADEYEPITDSCKLCLSANATNPLTCALWKAPLFANDGRNGLMLISKHEIHNPEYIPFETYVIKRGVLAADVAGFHVQCTHLTADLGSVPYPAESSFGSWKEEHMASLQAMADDAGGECTVLFGDLNTGPASEGVDAELPENFDALLDLGYVDGWTDEQVCTHCGENPLVCSNMERCGGHSSRIDHVLLMNCADDYNMSYMRVYDQEIQVRDKDGATHDTRLSDHYGLSVVLSPAQGGTE
jgi:endonuclease/exonuclease/phosphatase family metal-dependent hydrolase